MDLRSFAFSVLLWLFVVAVLAQGSAEVNKNNTCYKPCRVKSGPVCGTDGRNYSTRCHLSVAKCKARRNGLSISVKSIGFCRSSKPLRYCELNCTNRRQPICGTDKVTYRNFCQFKKAQCEKKKQGLGVIKILSRKKPCNRITPKTKSCRKLSTCPKVRKPVCGSDNKTYKNICWLKTANCIMKRKARGKKPVKKLVLKHWGACGRLRQCSSPWQQKCPPIQLCDQMLRTKRPSGKKSGGTSGIGKKEKETGKTKRSFPLSEKKSKAKKPKGIGKKRKILILKSKRQFLVCGSDGNTYPSICHLQVVQCNKIKKCQPLQMRHQGACKRS